MNISGVRYSLKLMKSDAEGSATSAFKDQLGKQFTWAHSLELQDEDEGSTTALPHRAFDISVSSRNSNILASFSFYFFTSTVGYFVLKK